MISDCYCDFDFAEILRSYNATRPIARKEHICEECGRKIRPGERYEHVSGVCDQGWKTFKTCIYCLGLRDTAESRIECLCWAHGTMREDVIESVRDVAFRIPGLSMAIGRWIVEGRRNR